MTGLQVVRLFSGSAERVFVVTKSTIRILAVSTSWKNSVQVWDVKVGPHFGDAFRRSKCTQNMVGWKCDEIQTAGTWRLIPERKCAGVERGANFANLFSEV